MKAIQYTSYGPVENLKLSQAEKPTPKENEVLIKVHFSAINDYDWSMVRGKPTILRLLFGLFKPKHSIPGMELSGTIEAVGSNVTSLNVGDAVYGDVSRYGFGCFAEYVSVNQKGVIKKPDYLLFEEAAALSHAANLAWQALVDVGHIKKGMKILINGGGGGVGTLGLQIAKTYDAEVTGVDTGEKLQKMKEIGFDHIIDYKRIDFTKEDEKYDLIIDTKTNRKPRTYLRALKANGRYVTVGGDIIRFLQLLVARKIRKKNVFLVGLEANKDLDAIHELYKKGLLKPVIDGPFPFEKTPWAIQHFGEGKHTGKVVIKVS